MVLSGSGLAASVCGKVVYQLWSQTEYHHWESTTTTFVFVVKTRGHNLLMEDLYPYFG